MGSVKCLLRPFEGFFHSTYNDRDGGPPCIELKICSNALVPSTLVPKVPGVEGFENVLNEAVMVESGHLVVLNDNGELQCYENVKLKLGLERKHKF